ncbi:MAG: glycosyltransferase family 2 protein [Rubrivivax sp.]
MTSFGRRDTTLAALASLERAAASQACAVQAVLVDDRSPDGTAEAVRARHAWVQVVESAGDLFWCRGMHLAIEHAMRSQPEFLLWLNDDTLLDSDALARLIELHDTVGTAGAQPAIVVGSTRDPVTGSRSYGGCRRVSGLSPITTRYVEPRATAQQVDTFQGNLVLVNARAFAILGNLDAGFEHGMGDTDYGFRAGYAGVPVWLCPGTLGTCSPNTTRGTYQDVSLAWRRRWALFVGRKGMPPLSWLRFTRRHAGRLWPLHFLRPYCVFALGLARDGLAALAGGSRLSTR